MTDTTPLTNERLEEIQDTLPQNDGYGPPWEIHHEMVDGYWLVHYDTDNPQAGLVAMVPDYGFRLAVFIAEAVTAVPDLLAEVRRLRAVEAAAYGFADEMADYCSPHGVSADYAKTLRARLDNAAINDEIIDHIKEQQR